MDPRRSNIRKSMICKILKIIQLSLVVTVFAACTAPGKKTAYGALGGAAAGAGTGAIVGAATGHAGPGIAIGAGIGALGGALIGNHMEAEEAKRKELEERQYQQELEIQRQNRELEEIRRQQRYDDLYQKY